MSVIRELDVTRKSAKANALTTKFADRIIGQNDAREALISLLEKFSSGMYNKKKPIGSLLFLGPTGSGKTLTVETFVEGLFGDPTKMMKVDCAEFQHGHEIARLIGSPPGYLGHRETHPFFTNASLLEARSDFKGEILPFTIVLFDEIEKASDTLWNLLLGILDKGRLTTGTNEVVDFTKTVILMTSNVGAARIANENPLGFSDGTLVEDDARIAEIGMAEARKKFMPEFLNRLDTIVNFRSLTPEDMKEILNFELEKIQHRIMMDANVVFEFRVSNAGTEKLLEAGYEKRYNARQMVRAVDKFITTPLTRLISTNQISDNDIVIVTYEKAKDSWKYVATHS